MLIDYKKELNEEQYKAVTMLEGPLLIIAGAGSGKTRVITFRIAHMLESGIPQSQILALTFTNKAAREMEARVKELTGKKLQNLTVCTFHAFGVRILRQHIHRLGWRDNFSIYDESDRTQLIKESARELEIPAEALDLYQIGNMFSNVKTDRCGWEGCDPRWPKLYQTYQEGLKLFNSVDFDDLITLPLRLFAECPDVLALYREHYRYILVDEFQDTSIQQYRFMHALADRNIAVVGDDDQSIYSWRGANYENIRMYERDFPGMVEIRLEQNYRSTETILEAANGVISHNTNRKDKSLWSGNGSGKPIEVYMPENESAEADFIAEAIQSLCASESRKYGDFGVLVRANTLTRAIEEAFLESNIPYTVSGGTSFFQRREIKDVISYLRVIANHDDDINLLRIINTPRRGIGRKTIEDISAIATQRNCSMWAAIKAALGAPESPISDKMRAELEVFIHFIETQRTGMLSGKGLAKKTRAMVDEIDYWSHLIGEYQKNEKAARYKFLNIESLINSMEFWENNPDTFDSGLFAYLNRITLLSRDDFEDDNMSGKVSIMTIHASKGLEFPVVFIAGAEEGIIPHERSLAEGDGNIEEERRLFYVAITRARDKLYVSSCQRRRKMQSSVECQPSPFLDEIPQHLITYHEPQEEVTEEMAEKLFARMKQKFAGSTSTSN